MVLEAVPRAIDRLSFQRESLASPPTEWEGTGATGRRGGGRVEREEWGLFVYLSC